MLGGLLYVHGNVSPNIRELGEKGQFNDFDDDGFHELFHEEVFCDSVELDQLD